MLFGHQNDKATICRIAETLASGRVTVLIRRSRTHATAAATLDAAESLQKPRGCSWKSDNFKEFRPSRCRYNGKAYILNVEVLITGRWLLAFSSLQSWCLCVCVCVDGYHEKFNQICVKPFALTRGIVMIISSFSIIPNLSEFVSRSHRVHSNGQ